MAVIECVGGGGGGALQGPVGSYVYTIGGGGGSGGYSRAIVTAAQIGASQPVTIGAGGYANTSGQGSGGLSGVGVNNNLCVAYGGQYASGISPGAGAVQGGAIGGIAIPGQCGQGGFLSNDAYIQCPAGAGGNSVYGGGATPNGCVGSYTNGQPATFFGGGGGGATMGTSGGGGNAAGGAGYSGVVYITEYW
jgi:hypothetical protein